MPICRSHRHATTNITSCIPPGIYIPNRKRAEPAQPNPRISEPQQSQPSQDEQPNEKDSVGARLQPVETGASYEPPPMKTLQQVRLSRAISVETEENQVEMRKCISETT
ncbi:hypothetical protein H9Q69_003522 [Fusarium xylarioides]|nr:hypothetical protein H9Q69_003522 [Fusarium xylarioides]